jgi:hypothetical protein
MIKTVNEHRTKNCPADMSGMGPDMSDFGRDIRKNCRICSVRLETFFSTLILEVRGTKLDETWTQGSHQYKEQVLKEVFPQI